MVVLLHPTDGRHAAHVPQFAASAARRAAPARNHAVKRILSPPNHSRLPSNPGSDSLYESFTQKPENHQMSLLEARKTYKPFEYPWAYDFWKRQQQIHWMPEEVPLGEDCRDWAQKLTEHERNLLTQIFRFFTQADVEVQDCYHDKYGRVFKPTEVKMMLTAFSNMETVHIAAYSHLLDTIGMPESEYSAFLEYEEMADKHNYMQQFGVDNDEDIARTLAMFGAFTEGMQLFASFAMLMNFPRFNKMKGMGQIVSWSVRDESLHCEGIIRMFHEFVRERDCLTKAVKEDIIDICQKSVRLEDNFIDLAFEMGPVSGMTPKEIKKYIRYIADWRLGQLGLQPIYMVEEHPLPWLAPLLNGVEHANFFEQRATEYSKGATRGEWNDVWSSFDKRNKAKAANEGAETEDNGPGLFGDEAGAQAAE
jgi:ribonucleoside-diphosphate reductase beta chain